MTESNGVFKLGDLSFWALGDRVIIEEDEFRTGYECVTCDGSGHVICDQCSGTQKLANKFKCHHCTGGFNVCPACGGKGGLIIAPETSQRRPTTGKVVSAGPDCKLLAPGQSVLYSNFAGYVIDLKRAGHNISLRILHESEVLCGMEGQLDLRGLRGKSEIAEFAS